MSGKYDDKKEVRKEGLRQSISMWENMAANSSKVTGYTISIIRCA